MSVSEGVFIYTYVRHRDEHDLCRLEMRSFFGTDSPSNVILSPVEIDPSRSPFMKERLEVLYEGESLDEILEQVEQLQLGDSTFRVVCLNSIDFESTKKIGHPQRRKIEREIGLRIQGEPDLLQPESVFGVIELAERWYFGKHVESKAIWYHHQKKPRMYSTALSTRDARAVANIAVPNPTGVRAIDPCCGIGYGPGRSTFNGH